MFYEFDQNNSGGHFDVTDTVCHRLFIEADSEAEAIRKAEKLGCYWNGVDDGVDCPCCGDRWSKWTRHVDLEKFASQGYQVSTFCRSDEWLKKYYAYDIAEEPKRERTFGFTRYVGAIRFHSIEEYAQYLADEYGWTRPDCRIFYADGRVKEIFSSRIKG